MPTYDYVCEVCDHRFEQMQSITADPLTVCPSCGAPRLKRLIGAGAGVIFKGSGFYETDYKRSGSGGGSSSGSDNGSSDGDGAKSSDSGSSNDSGSSGGSSESGSSTNGADSGSSSGSASSSGSSGGAGD